VVSCHDGIIRHLCLHRKKKELLAVIKCRVCDAQYSTMITELSEPVDVYCQWIDACEDANKRSAISKSSSSFGRKPAGGQDYEDFDDDEAFLDEEEDNRRGGYKGGISGKSAAAADVLDDEDEEDY
jgi:transcription elongation factor Elf1